MSTDTNDDIKRFQEYLKLRKEIRSLQEQKLNITTRLEALYDKVEDFKQEYDL